jgi:hypothetical protein
MASAGKRMKLEIIMLRAAGQVQEKSMTLIKELWVKGKKREL